MQECGQQNLQTGAEVESLQPEQHNAGRNARQESNSCRGDRHNGTVAKNAAQKRVREEGARRPVCWECLDTGRPQRVAEESSTPNDPSQRFQEPHEPRVVRRACNTNVVTKDTMERPSLPG
jgi:hypothetical protein